MPRSPITIRDVAKAAGLHYSTVSLALRRDPRILPATLEKVQREAKRLGYEPNPLFAALMSQRRAGRQPRRPLTLAYVTCPAESTDWMEQRAFGDFYRGATERAEVLGCRLDLFEDTGVIGSRLGAILKARGIRGVIFSTLFDVTAPLEMCWDEIVGVQIEPHANLPLLPAVSNDQTQIVREAFARCRALGHRRVGLALKGEWDARIGNTWLAGYLSAQHAVPTGEQVRPFISMEWNQEAFGRWAREERPDVVMSMDYPVVRTWLQECGLRVPADISYVDLDLNTKNNEIAGMRQSHFAVGEAAVNLVLGRLYRNETGPDKVRSVTRFEGEWCDGLSAPRRV